jgi:hypothetical protein
LDWFGQAVFGLDRWLRRRLNIIEYSSDENCLFRVQSGPAEEQVLLSDGTEVHPGDMVLGLHFWNEHMPAMDGNGVTLEWARQTSHALNVSFRELSRYLSLHPELDGIVAIRGDMRFGLGEEGAQLARLAAHFGFERANAFDVTPTMHRVGENILTSLLARAANPNTKYRSILRRDRQLVYMSRRVLQMRYGRETCRNAIE